MTELNQRMKAAGMKDGQLAEKVGCSRSMIAKIRAGKTTPSLPLALAIHSEIGVSLASLVVPEKANDIFGPASTPEAAE